MDDYYKLLGCERKADYEHLKEAYHKLIVKHHPDKNESADSKAIFQRIDKAWKTLRDPHLRKKYDNELKQTELNKGSLIYGTFTLKQLSYDVKEHVYYYPCRCGGQYYFSKNDIHEFNSYLVSCDACSLMISVDLQS